MSNTVNINTLQQATKEDLWLFIVNIVIISI